MIYKGFSSIYDIFIDADYDVWVDYILNIWKRFGKNPELVLELACGTGNITTRLAKKDFDMIGIDISEDMLSIARQKPGRYKKDILYLAQDMREFELYGTVDACLCLMDGINYILERDGVLETFKLVYNYLNPGGIFIFDINTKHKFENILSDNDFCKTTDDAAYTWENYYDEGECVNEYYINCFVKDKGGKYNRFEEFHYQKGYEAEEIKALLIKAGFEVFAVYDNLSFDDYKTDSEKIFFVAIKR
jgi:ubiquinone/menaquinone biosynthesis C-methylase UbiE